MTLDALALASAGLAVIPVLLAAVNLLAYRPPPAATERSPAVSVLIPARNEAANIEAAVRAALASSGVEIEVIVLDDASTDRTAEIVEALATEDPRVRLERAPPLPAGWSGKQHACHVLAGLAAHDLLVFVDADVRLAEDAVARMAGFVETRGIGLASGFPREVTGGFAEHLVIPIIHFLLLGYLPVPFGRWLRGTGFGAGCGQLFIARRADYETAGGHAAIKASLHDGIKLPRAFRRAGVMTDLFDATDIAACRMYRGAAEVWAGFSKNATEGMATPVALPVWTILLFGGQVLPFVLLLAGMFAGVLGPDVLLLVGFAAALTIAVRLVFAARFRQSVLGAVLHPVGVLIVLAIQWAALARALRGGTTRWRDRDYEPA